MENTDINNNINKEAERLNKLGIFFHEKCIFHPKHVRHFWSINSLGRTPPFRAMDRSASHNGFCHQQSRAVTVQPRAVTVRGINWVLIEEPTFQQEAAYLGPGRKGDCTSCDRLFWLHFKRVEPAKLYFAQCLRWFGGVVERLIDACLVKTI